jgi:hypothetical protein
VPQHPVEATAQVLAACARLQTLAGWWPPAGGLVEAARLALAGEGGLDAAQVQRLVVWSRRWAALDPRLRELYARHPAQGAVDAALWHVLEQRDGQASGAVYGTLRDLWTRLYGYAPSIELLPRITLENEP